MLTVKTAIGAMTNQLSTYLNKVLASNLSGMNFSHSVSTMFDSVLQAVDRSLVSLQITLRVMEICFFIG